MPPGGLRRSTVPMAEDRVGAGRYRCDADSDRTRTQRSRKAVSRALMIGFNR